MNIEFLKNKKVLLILAFIVVFFIIIFSIKSTPKDSKNIVDNSTQLVASYSDDKFGYFIEYPGWWVREEYNDNTVIRNEASNAIVLIKTEKFSAISTRIFLTYMRTRWASW